MTVPYLPPFDASSRMSLVFLIDYKSVFPNSLLMFDNLLELLTELWEHLGLPAYYNIIEDTTQKQPGGRHA